jgi:hypothetical protein
MHQVLPTTHAGALAFPMIKQGTLFEPSALEHTTKVTQSFNFFLPLTVETS